MINFKEYLKEAFDTKAQITKINSSLATHVYTFDHGGSEYFIAVEVAHGTNFISFGIGDPDSNSSTAYLQTNSNRDHFKVLSIIINGLIDHFKKYPIGNSRISFSAKGPSRVRAYRSIAARLAKQFRLEIEEMDDRGSVVFNMGRDL